MSDIKLLFKQLSQRPISYYPIYRDITESTAGGVVLSQLMYWLGKYDKIWKTDSDIMKETKVTKGELRAVKRKLKDLKFITITREGIPCTTCYEIKDHSKLHSIIKNLDYKNKLTNKLSEIDSTEAKPDGKDNPQLSEIDTTCLVKSTKHYNRLHTETTCINDFSKEKCSNEFEQPKDYNGLYCSLCNEKQFETRSGDTCINGHGGAKGIEKKRQMVGKLLKLIVKQKTPNLFNYSKEALQILNHWESCGGRIHRTTTAKKGPDLIKLNIEELLMPGRNPFIGVINDDQYELKTKKWSIKEIIASINQYAKVKHKPINKLYFNEFIIFRSKGFKARKFPDHSPLAESFQELSTTPKESKWFVPLKNQFTKLYPELSIYDTVYLNVADFLDKQSQTYKLTHNGACYQYSFVNLFVDYIKEKVNTKGSTDLMEYMSGNAFLTKFIQEKKNSFMLERKTLAN